MPSPIDLTCPQCRAVCDVGDHYCWSCGTPIEDARGSSEHLEQRAPVLVDDSRDAADHAPSRRPLVIALLALALTAAAGFGQLNRDTTRDTATGVVPLEEVLESATRTPAGPSGTEDSERELATTDVAGEPGIRLDQDVLGERDLGPGHLVFADRTRRHIEVVDLASQTRTRTDLPDDARLRAVSDLGLIIETDQTVERRNWEGTTALLGTPDGYLGGNTVAIARIPTGIDSVYFEYDEGAVDWTDTIPRGEPFFIIGDSIFTSSGTRILRAGREQRRLTPIGEGVIGAVLGNGLLAFDCLSGDPAPDDACLMDIYDADGSLVVSSRTASQLRWNVTAGGRTDAGLLLSHDGEMLAEPTQVGLGIWNTSGGTLRRIADVPLAALQWTADDAAVIGLGPATEGWAPVMELDIARGTTLPVGIDVFDMEFVGLGHGDPGVRP